MIAGQNEIAFGNLFAASGAALSLMSNMAYLRGESADLSFPVGQSHNR